MSLIELKKIDKNLLNINMFWNKYIKKNTIYNFDIENIKKLFKNSYKEQIQKKILNCDLMLKNKYLFNDFRSMEPCSEIYEMNNFSFNVVPFDDPEWTFVISRCAHHVDLVLVYLYTNDIKYLDRFFYEFNIFIKNEKQGKINENTTWRTIDSSIRIIYWLKCFRMLKFHDIPNDVKINFIKTINDHYYYLIDSYFKQLSVSNWGMMQFNALLTLSSFFDEHELTIKHKKYILSEIDIQIQNQFNTDGSHWEQSPMYHYELMWNQYNILTIMRDKKIIPNKRSISILKKAFNYLIKSLDLKNRLLNKGDSDRKNSESIVLAFCILWKLKLPITITKESQFELLCENGIWCDKIEYDIDKLSIDIFRDSGDLFYKDLINNVFFHFNTGLPTGGHSHSDFLHIDLQLKDKFIFSDCGRYTYVWKKTRKIFKGAESHNTFILNDSEYFYQNDSWTNDYSMKSWVDTFKIDEFIYISCISDAFLSKKIHGLVSRSILIRSEKYMVIISEIIPVKENEIKATVNFIGDNKIDFNGFENKTILKYNTDFVKLWHKGWKINEEIIYSSNEYNSKQPIRKIIFNKNISKNDVIFTFVSLNGEEINISKKEALNQKNVILDNVFAFEIKSKSVLNTIVFKKEYTNNSNAYVFVDGKVCKGILSVIDNGDVTQIKS